MNFFLCHDLLGETESFVGINLDDVSIFYLSTCDSVCPIIRIKMKDQTSIDLAGKDASRFLYAMKVTPPRVNE